MSYSGDDWLLVRTFLLGDERDGARKVVEEAAEAFSAYEDVATCRAYHDRSSHHDGTAKCAQCQVGEACHMTRRLADELADVVQAACNMAARYGIDMGDALTRCERRNRDRGRYDG